MRVNKSLFTQAVLASTVFCISSLSTSAHAAVINLPAAANGSDSGTAPYNTPADGYNFVDNNVSFTILDGNNVGNPSGYSIDVNNSNNPAFCNGQGCLLDEINFEGNSVVDGSVGTTNNLFSINLNTTNAANKSVEFKGALLNVDQIIFVGITPSTLIFNSLAMDVNITTRIAASKTNVHTVEIKDDTNFSGIIGSSARLIKTVIDNGKTLTVDDGSILFGPIDGPGSITYLGSTRTVSAIGGTTPLADVNFNGVAGKNANLNGNISAATVTVNNGGRLTINSTNTITTNGLTIANGELALAPSTTANVVGKFTLNNNNATLIVDMGGQAASTPLLAVTGIATVGGGANLTVLNPEYNPGNTTVPIITGGAGSALAPLTIINSNTFMTSFSNQVSGDTLNLVITSKSLSNFADQTNNIGAALSLNSLAASGANVTGELKNIINQITTFSDAGTLNYALSTLSPTVNGAVLNESFNAQNETFDAITDHFDTQAFWQKHYGKSSSGMSSGDAQEPSSAWVKIFKQYGNQAQRGDILGYKNDTWGIIAGGDAYVKDNILVGLALSWANLDINDKRSVYETTRANSYQASVYANLECDTPWYYNGMLAVAYNEYRSDRNILFGNVNLFPHADYEGWQTGAKVESGYVYDFDTMQFVPHTSLFYSHLSLNSYTETGANTANLFVDDADFDAMLWGGGFKFIKEVALENERFFQSEIHTRVFYDLFGDTMALTSQFTGGGPNFRTAGFTPARFSYNVGGNVSLYSRHNWVFTLSYDYDAKADYHANAGFLRIRHEF